MTLHKPASESDQAADEARVAYFLRMYPRFSQTFIVNEILELERQGLRPQLIAQRRPDDGIFHDSVCRVRAKAEYLPESVFGNWGKMGRAELDLMNSCLRHFARGTSMVLRYRDVTWFEQVQAALLVRWARKRRVSHLHVHFGTGEATVAWLARLMGGPSYSLTLHAFDIFRDNVNRGLLAEKINASAFTVTVCESNRRFMTESLPRVDADRILVNYNGIDLELFRPAADVQREPLTLFAVGRLIEKKGFIHLIRALGRLRRDGLSVWCVIAGDGPEESRLRGEIRELGLESQVRLGGLMRQEQVRFEMQRAAGFVLPCVQARDGNVDALPTVLLEAMAVGCPTISTRISGVPEIIEDGVSGLLVEPEDEVALAEAIRRLFTDAGLAARLSVDGRRRAEDRFDVRRNVAVMRELLRRAGAGERPVAREGGSETAVQPLPLRMRLDAGNPSEAA